MIGHLTVLRRQRHLIAVPTTPASDAVPCAHDLHIERAGQRVGLHIHPSGTQASLFPCDHNNEDGL